MDNKEQCRAEFEYWHRGEFGYFEPLLDYAGEYAAKDIEGRWKSWQAARATSPAPAVVQMTDEQIDEILENESYAGRNPNGRLIALPLGVECLRTLFRRATAAASLAKEIEAREREAHTRIENAEREGLIEFGTTLQKLGARLTELLDDDQFNNIEPWLIVLAKQVPAQEQDKIDAQRYRFLRKGFGDMGPDVDLHNAFVDGDEKMDAAIDKAIAAQLAQSADKAEGV